MRLSIIVLYLFLWNIDVYPQPYFYKAQWHATEMGKGYTIVYRNDLQTGEKTQFINDTLPGYWEAKTDPEQTWLFLDNQQDPYLIVNCLNPSIRKRLPQSNDLNWMRGLQFIPPLKQIYLGYTTESDQKDHCLLLNAVDMSIIDTTKDYLGFRFYSKDGSIIYKIVLDTTSGNGGESEWYEFIATVTHQVLKRKRIYDIGPPHEPKYLEHAENGVALFGYLYPKKDAVDRQFIVYNPENDSSYTPIHFPQHASGFISSNSDIVILREEQKRLAKVDLETGKLYLFDSKTSKLLNRLWLPDEGKVLIFTQYPQNMYYYLPKEERAIIVNLEHKITDNILIDSLRSETRVASINGWLGDNTLFDELDNELQTAKNYLDINDSSRCAQKINLFCQKINDTYIDSSHSSSSHYVRREAWIALYYNGKYISERLPQTPPSGCNVKLVNSTGTKITTGVLQYYEGSWKDALNNNDGTFTITTSQKSLSLRMTYEYCSQTKSNVSVGTDTVVFKTVNAQIKLENSQGTPIDTGIVQYYAGAWRNLGPTINGIASKELLPGTYSFRMTYAYASKDKQQDIGANPLVVFQTVNAAVQLQNSQGSLIDQGTVQYYSGAWRKFGVTSNGSTYKELLPNNYSFRMTYAYASKDKQQDIGTNPAVIFQTVNATVQLQNSLGTLISAEGGQGTVQYYSGAWREFGTTSNGVANKELLPNNYSFRMTYAYASKDKQQDLNSNPTVVFQTVNANVQLQNSQGTLIDQGTIQYYSGAWRDFGTTSNGVANKELLPNNYSFRMSYAYASKDKQQDIGTNSTVVFQTVNTIVQLKNSQGSLMDRGTVQYYSGAWRSFGTSVNGVASKELLPNNYTFRMTHEYVSNDKAQDLSANSTVSFSTVLCTVRVKSASSGQAVNNVMASYYSGAWRQIGNTVNGEVTKELLPANLTFRAKLGTIQQDKAQNLSTNSVVEFNWP